MACNAAARKVGRVWTAPVVRGGYMRTCRQKRRTRRFAPTAAAVDTQRTPVQVNQLLIAKDVELLTTTGQSVSSIDNPVQSDAEEFANFGPAEFSEQSTPYDAEQDWCERFGHYGRYTGREVLCSQYVKCEPTDLADSSTASSRDLLGRILCGVRGRTWQARAAKMIRSNSGMVCERQRLQVEGHIVLLVRHSHFTLRLIVRFSAADDNNAIHFVNLYDRQLPGENRSQLEHGLWQSTWYVTRAEVRCQQFSYSLICMPFLLAKQSLYCVMCMQGVYKGKHCVSGGLFPSLCRHRRPSEGQNNWHLPS